MIDIDILLEWIVQLFQMNYNPISFEKNNLIPTYRRINSMFDVK